MDSFVLSVGFNNETPIVKRKNTGMFQSVCTEFKVDSPMFYWVKGAIGPNYRYFRGRLFFRKLFGLIFRMEITWKE